MENSEEFQSATPSVLQTPVPVAPTTQDAFPPDGDDTSHEGVPFLKDKSPSLPVQHPTPQMPCLTSRESTMLTPRRHSINSEKVVHGVVCSVLVAYS